MSFFNKVTVDGKDVTSELIDNPEAYDKTDMRYFSSEMLKHRQFIPNEYLYYFFNREKAVANILNAEETRGELIERVNKLMIEELSGIDIKNNFDLFSIKPFRFGSGLPILNSLVWS